MTEMLHVTTVDPEAEWRNGFLGVITNLWTIAGGTLIHSVVSGALFKYVGWGAGIVAVGAGAFGVLAVLAARHIIIRICDTDEAWHEACHMLRDDLAKIISASKSSQIVELTTNLNDNVVNNYANVFRERLCYKRINCAIRLAEERGGEKLYVTRGRSRGMDAGREANSEPISADVGLAQALRNKNHQGVYLIHNIEAAIQASLWFKTKNDDRQDVRTLMVAPINGYQGTQKVMIGILYITAMKKIFYPRHAPALKAMADLLGAAYQMIHAKIMELDLQNSIRKESVNDD